MRARVEGGRGAPAQKRVLPKGESGSPGPSPVSRHAACGATTSPAVPVLAPAAMVRSQATRRVMTTNSWRSRARRRSRRGPGRGAAGCWCGWSDAGSGRRRPGCGAVRPRLPARPRCAALGGRARRPWRCRRRSRTRSRVGTVRRVLTQVRGRSKRAGSPASASIAAAPTAERPVMVVTSSDSSKASSTPSIRCSTSAISSRARCQSRVMSAARSQAAARSAPTPPGA
jgi:hypothetical protein